MIPSLPRSARIEAAINVKGGERAVAAPKSSRLGDWLRHRSGGLRPEPASQSQPFGRSSHIAGEMR